MKVINFLYYFCASVASCAAILFFVIVQPLVLLFVIPMAVFLLCFPSIIRKMVKKKLHLDCSYNEVGDKLIQLKTELDVREAKVSNVEEIITSAEEAFNDRTNKLKKAYSEKFEEYEDKIKKIHSEKLKSYKTELELCKAKLNFSERILKALVPNMRGEVYERYVGYKLMCLGFKDLNYTPVSKDFGADIIATDSDGKKVCIQCKRHENAVGIDAVQEINSARQYYDCDVAIVATNSTFTQSAKELAKKVGVVLWARFI